MRTFQRTTCLTLTAVVLLTLALSAGASRAATPAASVASLAVHLQQAVTPVFAGPVVITGPGVIIPAVPTPRSPFQPPTWVPSTPPWPTPTVVPPAPRPIR